MSLSPADALRPTALIDADHPDVLAFDGRHDSIHQACDAQGRRHMEYVRMRGEFLEVPAERIRADFELHYPGLLRLRQGDFDADVGSKPPAPDA